MGVFLPHFFRNPLTYTVISLLLTFPDHSFSHWTRFAFHLHGMNGISLWRSFASSLWGCLCLSDNLKQECTGRDSWAVQQPEWLRISGLCIQPFLRKHYTRTSVCMGRNQSSLIVWLSFSGKNNLGWGLMKIIVKALYEIICFLLVIWNSLRKQLRLSKIFLFWEDTKAIKETLYHIFFSYFL